MPDIAWVDTIDMCHLKCPTCIRGARGIKNTAAAMSLDTFKTIAARLRQDGFVRLGFYNWTEPFINRELADFVAAAKAVGFWVSVSSTLSLPKIPQLEDVLAAGLDSLVVSSSGMDQATHTINHVGANLAWTHGHLRRVREIIDRLDLPTKVDYRFIRFAHNRHQIPLAQTYADKMGLNLEVIPGDETKKSGDDATFRRYCEENALLPSPEEQGKSCNLMFSQMTIDCEGEAYICCVAPTLPSMRLGKFLELSADEILAKRFVHPFCRGCKYPRHDRTAEEAAWLSCIEPLIEKERADLEHHALDHHKVQGPATGLPLGI